MTTGILICPDCRAAVPHGRLSCSSCGSVLAAVAGGPRTANGHPRDDGPMDALSGVEPAPSAPAAAPEPAADALARPAIVDRFVPPILRPWDAPTPTSALDPEPASRVARGRPEAWPAEDASKPGSPARLPGAYLPPAVTYRPGVGAVETGIEEAGHAVDAARGTTAMPAAATAARTVAPSPASPIAGRSVARLADPGVEAPADASGWMAMAGSLLGALSFFLPWSPRVLGSAGGGGYLDRWGLANPANLLLLLALVATLLIVLVPNRLPAWFRFGALPLVVGGVHLGVAWLHLSVSYGYLVGMPILLVASLVLVAGGAVGVRHAMQPPTV